MRYWDYYIALENDLLACRRYVEFDASNMGSYSVEFMRLLLATCSEVEVLCKQLCQRISPEAKREHMAHYRTTLDPVLSLSTFQVEDLQTLRQFPPFVSWIRRDSPSWWDACIQLQHDRSRHYETATLEHSINALAGLYVLNLYHHSGAVVAAELTPESRFFRPHALVRTKLFHAVAGYVLPNVEKLSPLGKASSPFSLR